jgi:hypothetical protein
MLRNIYASMYEKYGVVYVVSHSEPVQLLVTMGISGLLIWILMWVAVFIPFFKRKGYQNSALIGPYCGLFAYLGQSLVNSAMLLNLCILVIALIYISNRTDGL